MDEAHQLTTAAFNPLLKTLEEPPPHHSSSSRPPSAKDRRPSFRAPSASFLAGPVQGGGCAADEYLRAGGPQGRARRPGGDRATRAGFAPRCRERPRHGRRVLRGWRQAGRMLRVLGVSEWEETSALFDALARREKGMRGRACATPRGQARRRGPRPAPLRASASCFISTLSPRLLTRAGQATRERLARALPRKVWEQAPKRARLATRSVSEIRQRAAPQDPARERLCRWSSRTSTS